MCSTTSMFKNHSGWKIAQFQSLPYPKACFWASEKVYWMLIVFSHNLIILSTSNVCTKLWCTSLVASLPQDPGSYLLWFSFAAEQVHLVHCVLISDDWWNTMWKTWVNSPFCKRENENGRKICGLLLHQVMDIYFVLLLQWIIHFTWQKYWGCSTPDIIWKSSFFWEKMKNCHSFFCVDSNWLWTDWKKVVMQLGLIC